MLTSWETGKDRWKFSVLSLKLFYKSKIIFKKLLFPKIKDKISNFSSHNNSGNVNCISRNNPVPLASSVSTYFGIHAE